MNAALQEQFGCKVYKLALSGGMTCPNRDGSCGTRGCIFCDGSGTFAECGDILTQLKNAKARVAKKVSGGRYIAYFQSFTNTYAPTDFLRRIFTQALSDPEVVALSVGTRPDCLPDDVIRLLRELDAKKPVWVELGLQTIHEKTAEYIRRGYALPVFDDAVRKLKQAGLTVIVHMILGLPGETRQDMIETAEYIGRSGADGIKLQLLHVLRGTDLADEYEKGNVPVLSLPEYISLLADCIEHLPKDMVIHRLTGDGAKKDLIAPLWSADKKRVLNAISAAFADRALVQGSAFVP
ncbi:MAG: TIGR01212 family radical SAM protein [Clostridia bacterium]|nr:TIGR01212 family radical SAM protein [Clostridia bacterium]